MRTASQGTIRRRIAVVLGAVLTLSAGLLSATATPGSAATPGGLTVGLDLTGNGIPTEFDPVQYTGPAGFFSYNWPIYAGLLRETPSGAYVPDLASKVVVADPSTINVTLRPGLVFSNGTLLDATAVKSALERDLTNRNPGGIDSTVQALSSVDVGGSDSLVLHFSQPVAATFYPLLAGQETFLALPTGASNGATNTNVVGAGPFTLKSFAAGQKIVLVKNPRYWDAKSIRLPGITFVNVPAGPQQINAVRAGTVDVETGIPSSDVPAVQGAQGLQLNSTFNNGNVFYASVCKSSGPLANLKVRQALNIALDRATINKALFGGTAQPAWSIIPSSGAYYDKSLSNIYAYNPQKAKKLLAQAGYPHGFTLTMMPWPDTQTDQMATVLQSQWKKIGVTTTIVQTSNYVTDLFQDNKAEIGLNPATLSGVQEITSGYVPGAVGNLCGYTNPTLDALANKLQATAPTSPELPAVWHQVEDFIAKNALSVYVVFWPIVTVASTAVKHLQVIPAPGGVLNYWSASLS